MNTWYGFSFESKRKANKVAKAFAAHGLTIKVSQFEKRIDNWNSYCTIIMVYALNNGLDAQAFTDKCNKIINETK